MSSWISYTIGPHNPDERQELKDKLVESFPDSLLQHSRYDDSKFLMPVVRENYDVLSTVVSTSKNTNFKNLEEGLIKWLQGYSNCMKIVYVLSGSDTGDFAAIDAYKADEFGLLTKINRCAGEIDWNESRIRPDEFSPEQAMMVVPSDEQRTDSTEADDCLYKFQAMYGYRPMLHYGVSEREVW